ncbi:MAG: LytR/AlgR family response regulator transcription factor [Butyricimonas faecihominis]
MISCIAIDDEPSPCENWVTISREPHFLNWKVRSSALEATGSLEKEIDLMFIDINMPDLSGMDFVKSLVRKPMIIFTTAYSELALEGSKSMQPIIC